MSIRHEPTSDRFWRYWAQVKAYCWMIETQTGWLDATYAVGDWKGSGPKRRVWERKFTMKELRENWEMIKQHGEDNRERLEERAA
jgi:hypothetical protein